MSRVYESKPSFRSLIKSNCKDFDMSFSFVHRMEPNTEHNLEPQTLN